MKMTVQKMRYFTMLGKQLKIKNVILWMFLAFWLEAEQVKE